MRHSRKKKSPRKSSLSKKNRKISRRKHAASKAYTRMTIRQGKERIREAGEEEKDEVIWRARQLSRIYGRIP